MVASRWTGMAVAVATAVGAGAEGAHAVVLDTFVVPTPVNSVDGIADPDNAFLTYTYAGPKATLQQFIIPAGAQLQRTVSGTFSTEAYVRVSSGATAIYDIRVFNSGGNYGSALARTSIADRAFTLSTPISINTGMQFQFEFFESYDDSPNATDQRWNSLSIQFGGDLFDPPTSIALAPNSSHSAPFTGQLIRWFQIDVTTPGLYRFDTLGSWLGYSQRGYLNDTELGLYDADGNLLATNDDIGGGSYFSQIERVLSTGTYYLAAAGNDSSFAGDFIAVAGGIQTGTLAVNATLVDAVPEPASLVLAGLGFGALVTRRRRVS